jgi:hypothetical protein
MAAIFGSPVVTATLFENVNYGGKSVVVSGEVSSLKDLGFNDIASSVMINFADHVCYSF